MVRGRDAVFALHLRLFAFIRGFSTVWFQLNRGHAVDNRTAANRGSPPPFLGGYIFNQKSQIPFTFLMYTNYRQEHRCAACRHVLITDLTALMDDGGGRISVLR